MTKEKTQGLCARMYSTGSRHQTESRSAVSPYLCNSPEWKETRSVIFGNWTHYSYLEHYCVFSFFLLSYSTTRSIYNTNTTYQYVVQLYILLYDDTLHTVHGRAQQQTWDFGTGCCCWELLVGQDVGTSGRRRLHTPTRGQKKGVLSRACDHAIMCFYAGPA